MPNCVVPDCKNSSETGYLMRCFPRNAALRAEWAKNINKPNWVPKYCHRICEVHFAPNMWEKIRVDGTRKLKYNAVPTIFKNRIIEEPASVNIVIPPSGETNCKTELTKNQNAVVKILPPANSKNAKPIILPASIFENQSNPLSTIIVDTEGKIINTQTVSLVPNVTSALKSQKINSNTIPSAPMIISTNASSSVFKDQIKSASNQSPIVITANASILKPQFKVVAQPVSNQLPSIQNKSNANKSILISLNNSVKKISTPSKTIETLSTTPTSAVKEEIDTDSDAMSMEEFSDEDSKTASTSMIFNKTQLKKMADDRFEKMDKLLLKQLRLNNALRKKLAAANHQLHQQTKERDGDFKQYLKNIFTDDQIRAIELRHTNPKSITAWSHKTMIKAIKLKECCGTRGYEELLKQNIPLPSTRTIARWCTQRNIPIP